MESAVHELLKKTIKEHKRIIFNGNGYTDEWIEEAEKRGLYNLVSTPDALPHFTDEKNEKLLTSHHIFTHAELHSRYEIKLENYVKTLHIEAGTMVEIIQKDLLPAVTTYMEKLAQTAALKKSVVPDISVSTEAALLTRLTELSETMAQRSGKTQRGYCNGRIRSRQRSSQECKTLSECCTYRYGKSSCFR